VVRARHAIGRNVGSLNRTSRTRAFSHCSASSSERRDVCVEENTAVVVVRHGRAGRRVVSLESRLLKNEAPACLLVPGCIQGGRLTEETLGKRRRKARPKLLSFGEALSGNVDATCWLFRLRHFRSTGAMHLGPLAVVDLLGIESPAVPKRLSSLLGEAAVCCIARDTDAYPVLTRAVKMQPVETEVVGLLVDLPMRTKTRW